MASRPQGPDLGALRIHDSARSSGGSKWRWFAAMAGVLVISAGAFFFLKGNTAIVEVAAAHAATSADRGVALLNASGYVTPRRRATVAAKITGRVTQVLFDEGMQVHEGQVLATLDDSDAKVRLASAEADRDATAAALQDLQVQLANAEIELHRTQQLRKDGVSSQQALDNARTASDSLKAKIALTREQVQAAVARVAVARQDLDNCTVRAPFSGIIVSKDAQVGEIISPMSAGGGFTRTGIATLVDMKSNEIEVDVNENYIARVEPGAAVTAVLDAYPDWQIPAHVRTIIPTADRQKATVKVRISFDKLDPRILPDMGVKVTFLAKETGPAQASSALLVPKEAVIDDAGKQIVFVYRDGRVERRAVTVGGVLGSDNQVIAGLHDGDQVVIKGLESLRDGQKVEVRR
jgi:RND family efflux transporter MFP subunit